MKYLGEGRQLGVLRIDLQNYCLVRSTRSLADTQQKTRGCEMKILSIFLCMCVQQKVSQTRQQFCKSMLRALSCLLFWGVQVFDF